MSLTYERHEQKVAKAKAQARFAVKWERQQRAATTSFACHRSLCVNQGDCRDFQGAMPSPSWCDPSADPALSRMLDRLLRDSGILCLALHQDLAADREEHKQFFSYPLNSYWILLLSKTYGCQRRREKREKKGGFVFCPSCWGTAIKQQKYWLQSLTISVSHL